MKAPLLHLRPMWPPEDSYAEGRKGHEERKTLKCPQLPPPPDTHAFVYGTPL